VTVSGLGDIFGATSCTGTGSTFYASPTGTGNTCTQAAPCTLRTAAGKPAAGDIVCLRGGTYTGGLIVSVSGTATNWISFVAFPGEVPMIDSGGVSVQGSYDSFNGIVARNASSGFGNKWTGGGTTTANGHLEFVNCIADMNTANGIAFHSSVGVHIAQSIVAHNGSSTTNSWSSGVDLFGAQGTFQDNVVERNVAFENVDMQQHTDGSGYIADDIGTGATFVNNIGFRNGGSCIRLTISTNSHIINNTCFQDGLDPQATNPGSPGEIFFSSAATQQGSVLQNNLAASSMQTAFANTGSIAIAPTNVSVNTPAAATFYTDPAGTNPNFELSATATSAIAKGSATNAPALNIGFDPKCVTKGAPTGTGVQSWWIYSIDYTYITSIGGVAKCFSPQMRTGTPNIGAY
jgi:hypothetical protein